MSSPDPSFSAVAHLLLQGKMICAVSEEYYFEWLTEEQNQQAMHEFLYRMDRALATTADEKAFFCAYDNVSEPAAKRVIHGQFKEVANHLEALVKWLKLGMAADSTGSPLAAGDILYESSLLAAIEQSPSLLESLTELARSSFVNSRGADGRAQLKQVLARLVEQGYLVEIGRSGSQYRATAKWSWLFEVMDFIRTHENLQDPDERPPEQGLLP